MAVRSSMAALITEVRLLINDPAGGSQVFTDQQIQDHLDDIRDDIWYEQMQQPPTIVNLGGGPTTTASFIYADNYSDYHWWETDVVIQDGKFNVLTPLSSDYIVGHWMFDSLTPFVNGTVPGQYPPVFITGKSYDVHLAAAMLWEMRAATLATAYDFTADGQSFHRSQQSAMCLKMAANYRTKARPRIIRLRRRDLVEGVHSESVPLFNVRNGRGLLGE